MHHYKEKHSEMPRNWQFEGSRLGKGFSEILHHVIDNLILIIGTKISKSKVLFIIYSFIQLTNWINK